MTLQQNIYFPRRQTTKNPEKLPARAEKNKQASKKKPQRNENNKNKIPEN